MSYIQFVNHASVLVSNGNHGILSDPWYEGSVFNNGWDLIVKNNSSDIIEVLDKVSHIWVSHEHPDHFSPSFFLKYKDEIINNGIKIIFQKTKDRRVYNFLTSKNFSVFELDNNEYYEIDSNFKVRIQKVDFYDSALIIDIDDKRIANLNDCPFETERDLKKFSNLYGPVDILLSQFGYAAWKGGKDNKLWRQEAAFEKLKILEKQLSHLKCKKLIPFASFIYFSNKENSYLNLDNNSPRVVERFFKNKVETVFFKPLEKQSLEKLTQNLDSMSFWDDKFSNIPEFDYTEYSESYSIEELSNAHNLYLKKLSNKNSFFLIKLLHHIKLLNIFSDIKIYLTDLDQTINLSVVSGITKSINKKNHDTSMHSESLMFILKNEFGFDTLTVNGNFEADKNGFSKLTKHLAIGSLNAMGLNLNIGLILNFSIYSLLIKKLLRVGKKLENY